MHKYGKWGREKYNSKIFEVPTKVEDNLSVITCS